MRLPFYYQGVSSVLETMLKVHHSIVVSDFEDRLGKILEVDDLAVDRDLSDMDYANFGMKLSLSEYDVNTEQKKRYEMDLFIFNPVHMYGRWTHSLVDKIWSGDFPSTIAVDKWSNLVYLLYVGDGLVLKRFGDLGKEKTYNVFDGFLPDKPVEIGVSELALYAYVEGSEGYNFLRKNLFVSFNLVNFVQVTVDLDTKGSVILKPVGLMDYSIV